MQEEFKDLLKYAFTAMVITILAVLLANDYITSTEFFTWLSFLLGIILIGKPINLKSLEKFGFLQYFIVAIVAIVVLTAFVWLAGILVPFVIVPLGLIPAVGSFFVGWSIKSLITA